MCGAFCLEVGDFGVVDECLNVVLGVEAVEFSFPDVVLEECLFVVVCHEYGFNNINFNR